MSFRYVLVAAVHLALLSPAQGGLRLTAIHFPLQLGGTGGPTLPPGAAPLGQSIVFEFDGTPVEIASVAEALQIRVDPGNTQGQPAGQLAFGTYERIGQRIIFTPRLPTQPLPADFGPLSDIASNAALPGLLPATTYRITVPVGSANSIPNLTAIKNSVVVPITFTTMAALSGPFSIAAAYHNAKPKPPEHDPSGIKPDPGIANVYPNPFADIAGLFADIPKKKRPPFRLTFQGPLDPSADNVSTTHIRLRAIATPDGTSEDLHIDADVVLTTNTPDHATVLLFPHGILPLGHRIAMQVSDKLRSIGGTMQEPGPTAPTYTTVAKYRVALDPGHAIDDHIVESFDTNDAQDVSIAAGGMQLATWDGLDSNHLRAAFGFGGNGELGAFDAPANTVVFLDTDFQQMPLLSGATPGAAPGTAVTGGVFHFTSFDLPSSSTLLIRGSRPAVINCTGAVVIEGRIDLNGSKGIGDNTFDSAISPTPGGSGGPGGGRGGDSHPVLLPLGASSLKFLQTPQFGQSGFGPGNTPGGGGQGGQCGATLPWLPFANSGACTLAAGNGDGSRGAGGGGGSFVRFFPAATGPEDPTLPVSGRRGGVGLGNHLPVLFDATQPIATEPGTYDAQPGNPTNALARVNPAATFREAWLAGDIWDTNIPFAVDNAWASNIKILLGGAAGTSPFDAAPGDNDFIGPGGKLDQVIGGQGGGGGGSRTEGSTFVCAASIFQALNLPFTVNDAKGSGGGGGGGALLLQALGTITFLGPTARIEARGGDGSGGETTETSSDGGSSGGGSGGCVILKSATDVIMNDPALSAVVIDVSGGCGHDAAQFAINGITGIPGPDGNVIQVADGGPGGPGLVQIHTPSDANIDKARINAEVFPSAFNIKCVAPNSGKASFNPLVSTALTPSLLSPRSTARSVWLDLGAVTPAFRPPLITSAGAIVGPLFGIPGSGPLFRGTDPNSGLVPTDASGFVIDPFNNDIEVDSPDLLLPDFLPQDAQNFQTVLVRFQGAHEDPANAGSPDLATATAFVTDITELNGRRFLRWQITFDIAADPALTASATTPLPQVNLLRIPFRY